MFAYTRRRSEREIIVYIIVTKNDYPTAASRLNYFITDVRTNRIIVKLTSTFYLFFGVNNIIYYKTSVCVYIYIYTI